MARILMVTGGARSGKSTYAEQRTLAMGQPAHYIATAQIWDEEMAERIAAHQARRGPEWRTHAEPVALVEVLRATDDAPRLVDCLTLWLTNLMLGNHDWDAAAKALVATLPDLKSPVVFVSNEVGLGIVPDNRLARDFRDAAGYLNQWVAAAADEVIFTVAGLPMKVK
ncbi:bifunctional adenosylcobinamide kinase/adenosylcobinamide-phosphate guanylyltransferase [Rhodobacter sp. TJ_12]|uniref:bifunctional adenosylcobinamide kinase/adenosylcobinamide-phosphate guanylyltransferase n=1 Tax=Rhodobacter sp. TJ_12 TaxID=2029399 RepID=UPI001CBB4DF4|nr:bifunctional adenosylcobinamide kinase/adenosylcobinamide-phosphate guanylyltransferase [Rhodobacter sp. TJ_12]MBZ4021642.1 bifunctional adenosylcobinamide kinase/adenosylcobinamide-phosphate guanylyltransferase [Rhodobacter sp. TJ_12]